MVRARATPESEPRRHCFHPVAAVTSPTTVRFTHFFSNQGNWKMMNITPGRKGSEYPNHDVHDQQSSRKYERSDPHVQQVLAHRARQPVR
jgi:hypothetical protein